MPTSTQPIFKKILQGHGGFTLIEILVAMLLAGLMFLAIPTGDDAQKHRNLQTAVADIERAIRFASNEAVLRNTVVRLKISLEKEPVEYNVEYGPAGNLPLPEMIEKSSPSLDEQKASEEKYNALNRQFTKVEEFEDIRHEIAADVTIEGIASSSQKKLFTTNEASLYFYPTGEKDGALVFFSTDDEIAYLEVQPFLSENTSVFEILNPESVARREDIIQTKMDEVYKEWITH